MTHLHSIWLMANPADHAALAETVRELSARFATPLFQPHLTLLGDSELPPADVLDRMTDAARAHAMFAAPIAAIETSEMYFRSFYARFVAFGPLSSLKAVLDPPGATEFMPHVSLLYGPVAREAKTFAACDVAARLVGRPIRFDRLCLVTSGQTIPIEDWRVVAERPLGSA